VKNSQEKGLEWPLYITMFLILLLQQTAEGTTEAVASVSQNKARYRAVLVAE
jgi:hypothetical protein